MLSVNCVSCLVELKWANWVSDLIIDHVVWLALCGVFISGSSESPFLSNTGE